MKEGWKHMKMGDICRINSGKSIKASFISQSNEIQAIPCYGGNGIRGYVVHSNYSGGNPIIGRVGAQCGNIHYCETPFYATEHALVVSITSGEIHPLWLCKQLEFMDLKQYAEGAAQPVIAASKLLSLSLIAPPIEEQRSIVTRLDGVFAHIDALKKNAEKQLTEARKLFQAELTECMRPKDGWEIMKLGDFAYMKAGNFAKASEIKAEYEEGLFPCYGGNGFRGYIKEPNQEGDYCMIGRQGALCGCINRANGIFRTTEHAVIVKPYKAIPTSLVYYLLVNLNLNKYATGAAQPGLSVNHIADVVSISVPPESEWITIPSRLDTLSAKVRELEEFQKKTITECDALKQALLREIFE